MTEKPTLLHIGKLAGVSTATVSRVINNHPNVKAEIRARVWKVIKEVEYRPNSAARSLAGQRSHIIGLVIPERAQMLFTDPFFPRLIQGIAQACQQADYTLSLFLFDTVEDGAKLSPRIMQHALLDGIILAAAQVNDPLIDHLLDSHMPFVLVGRHDDPRVHFVDVDNEQGAYTATVHLLRLGYERIAAVTGPRHAQAAVIRKEGYMRALRDRGNVVEERLIESGDFTETSGYDAMVRLLPQNPDAVFVSSDAMAMGAMRALRQAGKTVPNDVALVSFDDLAPAQMTEPHLTTVRQPVRQTGRFAVEMLIDILDHGDDPVRRMILPTELIIRGTCGAVR